ncbi:protein phosphatase 1 regulatory subunit 16A [Adelges cooleyi]|uniref:protein phosphatase 1 regulatory subunit 16A n=1 Tax=Adelges cooleyi TaxID=133065 RepID=UPI00217F5778|nr:protein phosphatase 1 regulatory subunit 16A [Adelges cooleyi]
MDHAELVLEMAHLERMPTADRLALARRRRVQQLRLWSQKDREKRKLSPPRNNRHIFFNDNVMLLEAASRNDIDEVKRLLVKGVSPDATNEDGLTALHQCCIDDNEQMMKLLVEFGANVNAEDSEKWTPLHAAATCAHLHLIKYLIDKGANLLAVNADGNMPYDICEDESALDLIESEMARRGVTQELIDNTRATTESRMLKELQQAVKDNQTYLLESYDHQGATPLHIAAANGYLKVVEFLLDHHVATDVKDSDDWQPVHAAACWGHLEVLEVLVQNGADLNAKTKNDETPSDICEDPDLRDRILQLRNEQETKKEAQKWRIRRTQSNNTRAQSVRRTSIREKTLTSKKDAVEEARLRIEAQNFAKKFLATTARASSDFEGDSSLESYSPIAIVPNIPTGERHEPEGENVIIEEKSQVEKVEVAPAAETCYTTESDGKINIHVSVTINAGTLAELKKQRAQTRAATGSINNNADLPSDSESAFNRFAGDTEDVIVGAPLKARRKCCIIF